MRPFSYILSGLALLVGIFIIGQQFSIWPAGIFNAAQVLSVIVLSPPNTGGGGNSGGGGGAGGGGVSTPGQPAVSTNGTCSTKGDLNHDGKVNIVDFSILAFWYKRPLTAAAIKQCVDQTGDGKVTLADFSILAYYWTK